MYIELEDLVDYEPYDSPCESIFVYFLGWIKNTNPYAIFLFISPSGHIFNDTVMGEHRDKEFVMGEADNSKKWLANNNGRTQGMVLRDVV